LSGCGKKGINQGDRTRLETGVLGRRPAMGGGKKGVIQRSLGKKRILEKGKTRMLEPRVKKRDGKAKARRTSKQPRRKGGSQAVFRKKKWKKKKGPGGGARKSLREKGGVPFGGGGRGQT